MAEIVYPELTPFSHQKRILDFLFFKKAFCANFSECGTGKTYVGVVWLYNLLKYKKIRKALIVSPKHIIDVWVDEFKKLYDLDGIHILKGPKRSEMYKSITDGIMVTNYELFVDYKFGGTIAKYNPQAIILDESHKIKNPRAKSAKSIMKMADKAKFKIVQTATPSPNGVIDIFNQMRFLDPNILEYENFYKWREDKFKQIKNIFWVPKQGTKDLIEYQTQPVSFHYALDDVTDAPPLLIQKIRIEGDASFYREYNELRKTIKNKAEKIDDPYGGPTTKLRQLSSGFLYDIDQNADRKNEIKIHALEDLIESIGEKQIMIWAHFKEEYEMIRELLIKKMKFPKNKILILADYNKKYQKVEEFKSKKYKIMVAHPSSIGYGLTINCKYVIWYSLNIVSHDHYQANMRVRRIGVDTSPVMVYYLMIKKTINPIDYSSLNSKSTDMKKYLAELRDHILL